MYFQLLTFGIGCFALSKLFCVLCLLTIKELPYPFNVGYLGYTGCFAFLFSAHYGQLDSIIDDGGEETKMARRLGFLAPAVMLFLIAMLMFSSLPVIEKFILGVIYLPALAGSYYNLKHLLADDCGFLFLQAIRPCNIPILFIYVLGLGRVFFEMMGMLELTLVCSILLSIAMVTLIIMAERGHKQWRI